MASPFEFLPWFRQFQVSPVTDWQRFINPQFNVTINQGDATVENHVLARAGSYGKQLGRMQEMLDILLERLPPPAPSAVEERSIAKYRETRAIVVSAVDEAKQAASDAASDTDIDRLLDGLAKLHDTDRNAFAARARQLREFLDRYPPAEATRRERGTPASRSSRRDR